MPNKNNRSFRKGLAKSSSLGKYIGSNTQPVCRPTSRRVKPLSGPVHPGASPSSIRKPKPMSSTPFVRTEIRVAEQNFDLYQPVKKRPKKKRTTRKK